MLEWESCITKVLYTVYRWTTGVCRKLLHCDGETLLRITELWFQSTSQIGTKMQHLPLPAASLVGQLPQILADDTSTIPHYLQDASMLSRWQM